MTTNLKPADELLTVRRKIKELQDREKELKDGMQNNELAMNGDFAIARFVKRSTSRFNRAAAEKELGSLARFDEKGETVALMVDELVQVVD